MSKNLKQKWDKCRLALAKILFDRAPKTSNPLNPKHIHAILFLRQDGKIGDSVVSAFALREIKKHAPHIQIGVLCNHKNRAIFEHNPYIDAIHEVKHKSLISYIQTAKAIAGQYDVVIELSTALRPRDLILMNLLNAQYYIGLDKADYQIFNINISNTQQHYTDIFREALERCGFQHVDTEYILPENPTSADKVQAFLKQHQIQHYIAINFFGASNRRCFDEQHIRQILSALSHEFPQQTWILLTYPEVTPLLERIQHDYPQCYMLSDTQTIEDSVELIRHADAVVTPDTAIVHIGVLLQKYIIGLYRNHSQNLANWHPRTEKKQLVFFEEHIHQISVDEVVQAVKNIQR